MKEKLRKNYQRKLNKLIREINKNIAEDNLWRGRFEFFQSKLYVEKFSDNSGIMFHVYIRGYDKETGYCKTYILDYAPWLSLSKFKLWEIANKFIVEDCDVWNQTPNPRDKEFVKDYTNISVPKAIRNSKRDNFYISYLGPEHWNKLGR